MPSFWDEIQVEGSAMRLYTAMPEGAGPFPAIVVAQPAGGVDEFVQHTVDRLAREGYAVVAPELYHRTTPEIEASTGKTPRQLLDDFEVVADVNATVDFLRNHTAIDSERIGITGFCMGGRVVWLAAATNPHFKAAVAYYGGFIFTTWGEATQTPFDQTAQIDCPLLFHFGEIDPNPSLLDMRKFDEELTRRGKEHVFYTYPDADHRFFDHTFTAYQKAASDLSWERTLEFFGDRLKRVAGVE